MDVTLSERWACLPLLAIRADEQGLVLTCEGTPEGDELTVVCLPEHIPLLSEHAHALQQWGNDRFGHERECVPVLFASERPRFYPEAHLACQLQTAAHSQHPVPVDAPLQPV